MPNVSITGSVDSPSFSFRRIEGDRVDAVVRGQKAEGQLLNFSAPQWLLPLRNQKVIASLYHQLYLNS